MTYENLKTIFDNLKKYFGKSIKNIYKIPNGLALEIDKNTFLCFSYSPSGLFLLEKDKVPLLEEVNLPIKSFKIVNGKLKKDDKILALKLFCPQKQKSYYLIFEITGKNSNFFILDENRKILYMLRDFQSQVRNLKVGSEYKFPPIFFDVSKEKNIDFETEKRKFLNSFKKQVENVLNQKIKNLEKKLQKLKEEINSLKNIENPEKYLKLAELIKANLYKYDPNKHYQEIEVLDFESGENQKINLNPSLSLKDNLDNFFKQYKKLKRKKENQEKIKEVLVRKKTQIENYIYFLKNLAKENLYNKKLLEILFKKTERKKDKEEFENVLIFKTKDGSLIFVGKNEKGNQKILKILGDKNDIWFHTKNYPGSHVILKLNKKYSSLEETLNKERENIYLAAKYAKIFSSLYKESIDEKLKNLDKLLKDNRKKAEVDFTFLKDVRKIKGTSSKVTYRNYKTLLV